MPVITAQDLDYKESIKLVNTVVTNQYAIMKIFRRIKKGYSPLVLIVGSQRIGKSFIGIWLCSLYMNMMNKNFCPELHTFYDPMLAIERLGGRDREPILIDEAGAILTRREWYKKTHQALDKIIQTQAYKTMLYIFISPFASDIDKTFQKHFDFLFRVDDRGRFKAFQIMKKYDEFNSEKATSRIFLDDVQLNLCHVPPSIWKRYLVYSVSKKEDMRITSLKESKHINKDNFEDNPFMRLKKRMIF